MGGRGLQQAGRIFGATSNIQWNGRALGWIGCWTCDVLLWGNPRGAEVVRGGFNPNGAVSRFHRRAATPMGCFPSPTFPRFQAARSSQPWALSRNPFGIHVRNLWKEIGLAPSQRRDCTPLASFPDHRSSIIRPHGHVSVEEDRFVVGAGADEETVTIAHHSECRTHRVERAAED